MARLSPDATGASAASPSTPEPRRDEGASDRRLISRMLVGAAALAVLLIGTMVAAAEFGWLPVRILSANADVALPPRTSNPETTAVGAEPIYSFRCGYVQQAPGAQCAFYVADSSGDLVAAGLTVSVPGAWLARQPHGSRPDAMNVVAALVHSSYAPVAGQGLDTLAFSVDPSFAAKLRTVGITPQAFVMWIYRNVPASQRPPWARGGK